MARSSTAIRVFSSVISSAILAFHHLTVFYELGLSPDY
jgi:hypothetical protein